MSTSIKKQRVLKSLDLIHTKVYGISNVNQDGSDRQKIVERDCYDSEILTLVRDPHNVYDSNAVKVCLPDGQQIGFLSESIAKQVAPRLDAGAVFGCAVEEITGGLDGKCFGANLALKQFLSDEDAQTFRTEFNSRRQRDLDHIQKLKEQCEQYKRNEESKQAKKKNQNALLAGVIVVLIFVLVITWILNS